ncbi:hypothetical protein [Tautonia plasticadhaerens]|uniref:Uncharacterized protein n=1 Tax=Tautonia plasticadhaerens TaxID=2527974 RepID=A0A518H2A8_9BACT|nr:hypothetical protein [Tautonia plasticadhaerens]QDV34965.1 hypothetical protein ElP_28620 [Tautonia plasticadhaerens]
MRKYKLKAERFGTPAGTIVYDCIKPNYGVVGDDTRATGVEHRSVTLQSDGDYPFFTVPVADLEPLDNAEPQTDTARHTPGPWECGDPSRGESPVLVYCDDATGSIVAQVGDFQYAPRPRAEALANARLIAAAPELLDRLVLTNDTIELMRLVADKNHPRWPEIDLLLTQRIQGNDDAITKATAA